MVVSAIGHERRARPMSYTKLCYGCDMILPQRYFQGELNPTETITLLVTSIQITLLPKSFYQRRSDDEQQRALRRNLVGHRSQLNRGRRAIHLAGSTITASGWSASKKCCVICPTLRINNQVLRR